MCCARNDQKKKICTTNTTNPQFHININSHHLTVSLNGRSLRDCHSAHYIHENTFIYWVRDVSNTPTVAAVGGLKFIVAIHSSASSGLPQHYVYNVSRSCYLLCYGLDVCYTFFVIVYINLIKVLRNYEAHFPINSSLDLLHCTIICCIV